jgi:hypothetical protein
MNLPPGEIPLDARITINYFFITNFDSTKNFFFMPLTIPDKVLFSYNDWRSYDYRQWRILRQHHKIASIRVAASRNGGPGA